MFSVKMLEKLTSEWRQSYNIARNKFELGEASLNNWIELLKNAHYGYPVKENYNHLLASGEIKHHHYKDLMSQREKAEEKYLRSQMKVSEKIIEYFNKKIDPMKDKIKNEFPIFLNNKNDWF